MIEPGSGTSSRSRRKFFLLKDLFRGLSPQAPMFVLRTWSNGWLTICRMHESPMWPCIFGCDFNESGERSRAPDSLKHYLKCEPLWALVYSCTRSNSVNYLQQSPEERACICNINSPNLHRLYVAFSLYHSLKKLHFESVQNAVDSGNVEEIFNLSLDIIKELNAAYNPNRLTLPFPVRST